jgi:small subunit ribosomal protein S1
LQEGEIVEGTVKNLTDYGAFVDSGRFGRTSSHTDISHGRVGPLRKLSVGDRIKVKVLHFDREKEKVAIGTEADCSDPGTPS